MFFLFYINIRDNQICGWQIHFLLLINIQEIEPLLLIIYLLQIIHVCLYFLLSVMIV